MWVIYVCYVYVGTVLMHCVNMEIVTMNYVCEIGRASCRERVSDYV